MTTASRGGYGQNQLGGAPRLIAYRTKEQAKCESLSYRAFDPDPQSNIATAQAATVSTARSVKTKSFYDWLITGTPNATLPIKFERLCSRRLAIE